MLNKVHTGAVRPVKKSQGYFLFELVLSALMIAAIVVLAFPTYQDFTPEQDVVGSISVLDEAGQSRESMVTDDSASLAVEQEETESVPAPDSASSDENTTS